MNEKKKPTRKQNKKKKRVARAEARNNRKASIIVHEKPEKTRGQRFADRQRRRETTKITPVIRTPEQEARIERSVRVTNTTPGCPSAGNLPIRFPRFRSTGRYNSRKNAA